MKGKIAIKVLGTLLVSATLLVWFCGKGHAITNIRVATYLTPAYVEFDPLKAFVDGLNAAGQGKVKVEFFPSETLLKAKELLSGLMTGTAEMVAVPIVYWHGTFPLSQGLSLPFLWKGDMERYSRGLAPKTELANFLNSHFAKKNISCIFSIPDCREFLWTVKREVRTASDMKGLKLRTSGIIPSEIVARLEASPVSMASGEIYTALQRGTVDGILASILTVDSRGLNEQLSYMTNFSFNNFGPLIIAYRADWHEKLPVDIQNLIEQQGKQFHSEMIKVSAKATRIQLERIKQKVKILEMNSKDLESFNKALLPIHDWWTARNEIGEDGKKLLELIRNVK